MRKRMSGIPGSRRFQDMVISVIVIHALGFGLETSRERGTRRMFFKLS